MKFSNNKLKLSKNKSSETFQDINGFFLLTFCYFEYLVVSKENV